MYGIYSTIQAQNSFVCGQIIQGIMKEYIYNYIQKDQH